MSELLHITFAVPTPLADVERAMLERTLEVCFGNKTRAAQQLGISLKTLYNRLDAYRREKPSTFPARLARAALAGQSQAEALR